MRRSGVAHRWVGWGILVALLVGALLSAPLRGARAAPVDGWVEVCSVSGSTWVRLDGATTPHTPAPAGDPAAHDFSHCPGCLAATAPGAPPPAEAAPLPRPVTRTAAWPPAAHALPATWRGPPATARGPPSTPA